MTRKMKNSGIEWIGEIPFDWEITTIKRIFTLFAGATPKSEIPENWDGDIVWITPADYKTIDKYVSQGKRNISEMGLSSCSATLIPCNSIIFSKRAPIGSVVINSVPLCTNQGCISNVPKNGVNTIFYYYVMSIYTEQFELYSAGTTFKEISANNFGNFKIVFPPFYEQQKIANYLDKKCAEIDLLSSNIQSQINILEDYKKSVITEAVTKGLNPDAEMKDSGIEWIGEIPMNWEVSKIKYELECKDELREPISAEKRDRKNPQYDYYGASGIIDKIDYYNVDDEVLLIGEDGANLVMRNLPLIYKAKGKFWVNNHAHILKPFHHNDYNYLGYLLEAGDYTNYITGSAQPKLSQSNLMSFYILKVPIEEQKNIADYLGKRCEEIDAAINEKKQQLEVLEQYKKSLIYEYVTGKKEVIL